MKGIITLLPLVAMLLIAGITDAAGQTPKRIQFAKGRSSAVVKGTTAQNGAYFVLRAKSGQMLVLDVSPASGIGIKVETVGRYGHSVLLREEGGGRYEIGLEESGEYTIFIGSIGGKPVSFTLAVAIRRLADV